MVLNGPLDSELLIEESALSNLARGDESLDAQVEQFWKIETVCLSFQSMIKELLIYGNGQWR